MPRYAVALFLLLACARVVACTIPGAPDVDPANYDQRVIFPGTAYSGFNANRTYTVLFSTNAPNPVWAVVDPSFATIAPAPPPVIDGADLTGLSFAVATMTKAGEVDVTCRSGDKLLKTHLVIKAYTDDDVNVGQARYQTLSDDPLRPPCASCHQRSGGVDHSPLKMAGYDDQVVLGVIQNATYPPAGRGQSTTSKFTPKGPLPDAGFHTWNLTDPEKVGILAYLRSLPLGGR